MNSFIETIAAQIQKYAPQYGIKVHSPIIAQAILESASGTSELAVNACNYFGMKYRPGRCPTASGIYYKTGSEQNPDGSYTTSAMRWMKFDSMEDGVIGYFDFINITNYAAVKLAENPLTYLENIKAAGYATSLKYVQNLMAVIEEYGLTKYDNMDMESEPKMAKVFLSAGHGGSNPGAVANGLKEKDINLNTLLACKEVLEQHGVTVVASRLKDENDDVYEEVSEANASGAEIAVSFHANAGGGDGFEAFYHTSNSKGKQLAVLCEKYVMELGQNSRGIKSGNHLYFVKNTKMTSVLVESFFLDNAKDKEIGDTLAEQKAFGMAYAKAILEYLGIPYLASGYTAPKEEAAEGKLYRIQVGAYKVRSNAEAMMKRLEAAGFKGFITEVEVEV